MLCKIADLVVDVPAAGGLASRCAEYLHGGGDCADIVIRQEAYRPEIYPAGTGGDMIAYMESASQFCKALISFGGFYLHSSAVVLDGKAYLFSGPSRVGKSTHTRLRQQLWKDARVINDDKPALRRVDGVWYAYGTPWCGKDGINLNEKAPVAGVCFLRKAPENNIRRLDVFEATRRLLGQTIYRLPTAEQLDLLLASLELFTKEVPVFELENRPEPDAARLSWNTMRRCAEEISL